MKLFYTAILALALLPFSGIAQTFDLNGQIRPRAEFRNGYRSLIGDDIKPTFSVIQRTRLNLNYTSKVFKSVISVQDIRVWGDVVTANKSDLNGMMVHQAWGELFLTEKLSLKAGRQALVYDDQRLFGSADWNPQARSHEALLVKYTHSKTTSVHAGFAYNQSADKDTGNFYALNNYKALQYLWAHHEAKNLAISLLFANNGMPYIVTEGDAAPEQQIRYTQTFGPYLTYKKDKLKINLASYYQTGKNNKDIDKQAWYAGGELEYTINTLTLGAGFQYLSGNNQVNPDGNDHEFSTLFGTGHKFNGWMDYFYAGNSHKGVGLLDLYIPVNYKKDKLSAEFQLHYFQAAASVKDVADATKTMEAALGAEAGVMLSYAVTPEMSISGGYSQMFGTKTLQVLKGGNRENTQNWVWVMLSFNPVFFKSEK